MNPLSTIKGTLISGLLIAIAIALLPNHGAEDEADEQRRHDGTASPERDVAEQIEQPDVVGQRIE